MPTTVPEGAGQEAAAAGPNPVENAAKISSATTDDGGAPEQPAAKKPRKDPVVPKPDAPLVGLKRRNNGNYDITNKNVKLKDISREEVIGKLEAYVEKLSKIRCNPINHKNEATTCTCMRFLEDQPFIRQSVAHALMDYFDLSGLKRKHYAVERMRHSEMGKEGKHSQSDGPRRVFFLPLSYDCLDEHCKAGVGNEEGDDGGGDSADDSNMQEVIGKAFKHRICSHAFNHLHNIGVDLRKTLTKYADGDISAGRRGGTGPGQQNRSKKYAEAYESLRQKLTQMTEEYREYADANGDIALPVEISRRKTFVRWCRERGWRITKTNPTTGVYSNSDHCEMMPGYCRTEEEAVANGGLVAKNCFAWATFNTFWGEHFPQLKTEARVGKGKFGGNYCTETKRYYPRSGAQAREITPDWRE